MVRCVLGHIDSRKVFFAIRAAHTDRGGRGTVMPTFSLWELDFPWQLARCGVPLRLTTLLRGYLMLLVSAREILARRMTQAVSVAQLFHARSCIAPFLALTGLVKGHPGIPGLTPQLASCQLARRLSKSNLCAKSLLPFC